MSFTKPVLKTIRNDINVALAEVAKKHGISLELGTIRFGADNFRCTLSARSTVAIGQGSLEVPIPQIGLKTTPVLPSAVLELKQFGIDPAKISGKGERIIDYTPRKPKYPVIIQTIRGAKYKISIQEAASRFAA